MLFVEINREVLPRDINMRHHKAVITGIKDGNFVVIMKQDRSFEIVRVQDIVLTEKVYTKAELENSKSDFYKITEAPKKGNDFERFKMNLEKKVADELLKEMKSIN